MAWCLGGAESLCRIMNRLQPRPFFYAFVHARSYGKSRMSNDI
jgi:hypothetical protein